MSICSLASFLGIYLTCWCVEDESHESLEDEGDILLAGEFNHSSESASNTSDCCQDPEALK